MAEAKETEESVSFTIQYFGIPGRGAPLRAAAFLGGISYKDQFVTGAEHGAAKKAGKKRWSGMPEVTLHDKDGNDVAVVAQSNVCLSLIGQMAGLYPKNMVQAALVEEVTTAVEDMIGAVLAPTFGLKDDELKKAREALVTDKGKLPYWFSKFENRLTENEARGFKNGYFVGDSMTVADLKAFYGMNGLMSGGWDHLDVSPLMKDIPKIAAFVKKMNEDEGIKKFNAAFAAQQAKTKENPEDKVHVIKGKNVYMSL